MFVHIIGVIIIAILKQLTALLIFHPSDFFLLAILLFLFYTHINHLRSTETQYVSDAPENIADRNSCYVLCTIESFPPWISLLVELEVMRQTDENLVHLSRSKSVFFLV